MFYVHALGAKTVLGLQYKVVPLGPDSMVHLKNITFFFLVVLAGDLDRIK